MTCSERDVHCILYMYALYIPWPHFIKNAKAVFLISFCKFILFYLFVFVLFRAEYLLLSFSISYPCVHVLSHVGTVVG